MPGLIVSVTVNPGDQVRKGQELCILEAMKMEQAIRSPHEGKVNEVNIASGQRVSYEEVLFVIETY
jgi:biotin carboxyl carrier protein